jgi:nitrate/nitrite transporter NarK
MNNTHWMPIVGMAAGIVLGLAGAFGGLGAFLLVLVLGAVGFLVGQIAETGEVNLSGLTVRRK